MLMDGQWSWATTASYSPLQSSQAFHMNRNGTLSSNHRQHRLQLPVTINQSQMLLQAFLHFSLQCGLTSHTVNQYRSMSPAFNKFLQSLPCSSDSRHSRHGLEDKVRFWKLQNSLTGLKLTIFCTDFQGF